MMHHPLTSFPHIWLVDFEFRQPDGERPSVLCMVAREWRTGQMLRLWQDDLLRMKGPPFPTGPDTLLVAYYASAELSCYLALGWPLPERVLDLYAEFRCLTSGLNVPCGNGLLGALTCYGLHGIDAVEKGMMRELALRGGPYTEAEQAALLDYCQSDVDSLAKLLPAMLSVIDVPRALLRGRYMAAVARMEYEGIPIDVEALDALRTRWMDIRDALIERVDADYGVYDEHTFRRDRFAKYLIRTKIPWPHLPSNSLALGDDVFRQMAKAYPQIAPLRELRHSLSELRLESLAVGSDGRNRCLLSAFASKTGRNQPSNTKYIFGPSVWMRGLIRPPQGRALAYIDWEQQEFGIAAALSGDIAMKDAYSSGDPYLAFAKQAGAVPADATKASHGTIRDQFKVCALAVQYGMGDKSLAESLGVTEGRARQLLQLHKATYPTFWAWSEAAVNAALLHGKIATVFGWTVHAGNLPNPRSLANFPMQANGAEMLRLACCLATERGIQVCGPVHDALLIEAPVDSIEHAVVDCQAAMREASRIVLDGFELRSDCKIVRWPDRYMDARGQQFWDTVWELVNQHNRPNVVVRPLVRHCVLMPT